ncbi:MAG: glycosyltransferase family 4 protein [Chthonomonadales bacterium]|nr:glycosyltransferase family 4 protein [Chthonomonadales bacterium]
MRILLVCQNYLPFIGGIEIHARQVAHTLAARHDVKIVAVTFAPSCLPARLAPAHDSVLAPSFGSYDDDGVPVHALTPTLGDRVRMLPILVRCTPRWQRYAYNGLRRFGYRWYRSVFWERMRELVCQADVVHSLTFGYVGWLAEETATACHVPFVCTSFAHPRQWGDGPDDIALYRRSDVVICLTESNRAYLVSGGVPIERTRVVGVSPELPLASDPSGFRARHGLGTAPVVLYVGRMMAQKGARAVLEAAEHVRRRVPDARFVFIGPATPTEAALFEGSDARASYLGKVSLQEKADALSACDVFCMPSVSEILPTVYLEAWSYAKPVIGGMAHGLPELVEGHGAGVCASQDPVDLASILVRLLEDEGLRTELGENGRRLVEREYSVPAVTNALESIYRSVCDRDAVGVRR